MPGHRSPPARFSYGSCATGGTEESQPTCNAAALSPGPAPAAAGHQGQVCSLLRCHQRASCDRKQVPAPPSASPALLQGELPLAALGINPLSCCLARPGAGRRCVLGLTQHADPEHEGIHPVRHDSGSPSRRARWGHHLLRLSFFTLHLPQESKDQAGP